MQEIFNKVWQYFVVEKHTRSTEGGKCFYRHPSGDGRRCVVGLFIKDEEYHKTLETFGAHNPDVLFTLVKSGVLESWRVQDFLRDLQIAHDQSAGEFVEEERLRQSAASFKIKVPSENT